MITDKTASTQRVVTENGTKHDIYSFRTYINTANIV